MSEKKIIQTWNSNVLHKIWGNSGRAIITSFVVFWQVHELNVCAAGRNSHNEITVPTVSPNV